MGQTIVEKIFAAHTPDEVVPGKVVWLDIDLRTARDFGGPNVVNNYKREYAGLPLADRHKTYFTFDLCAPACTLRHADNQQVCREFAREFGVAVYDVDRGIGSHVLVEEGLTPPGATVVGTDSHMNILGAIGCFGQGMGDVDVAFAFRAGTTWFEVPETVKVILKGSPPESVSAKDLTLHLAGELGTKKIALKAAEFYGPAAARLTLAGRLTLCSMITEMAGIIGFLPECALETRREIEALTGAPFSPVAADPDAAYADVIEVDVSSLSALAAAPPSPNNVRPVSDLRGIKIDSGFIGSCTNGRGEDFVAAARLLKGRHVQRGVMLKVVPATRRVYQELFERGVLLDLFEAGAIIVNPGCGGCAEGHTGLTGQGEVQVSTGNRNFPGKQGKGQTYLASPAVVAASCVLGRIAGPEDL